MERSKANAAEYNEAYDAMCEIARMLDCAEDWAAIKGKLAEAQKPHVITRDDLTKAGPG